MAQSPAQPAGAVEFLRRAGADRLAHAHGRVLWQHLIGTREILRRWLQPAWLQDAGALHSIYATDVYQEQLVPLSRRDEVRAAVGARAERLAYLFCALSRQHFFELVNAHEELPADGLRVKQRFSDSDSLEPISRAEACHLLLIHMANEAEQAQAPSGEPGLWLARVSRMGSRLSAAEAILPPLFDSCTSVVTPEAEKTARHAYLAGLDALPNIEGVTGYVASAVAACPWIAEPRALRAYLALRKGAMADARLWTAGARKTLIALGTSWDKRLDYHDWLRFLSLLDELSFARADIAAALPAFDIGNARQFLDALAGIADPSARIDAGITPRREQGSLDGASRGDGGTSPRDDDAPGHDEGVPWREDAGLVRFRRYVESFAQDGGDARMRFYPGLTARPWHDPSEFPLARLLADHDEEIRSELAGLDGSAFHPESERIGRTGSWDVFLLFERGRKNADNCARCPVTTRLIETNNTVRTLAGLIYFSRMKPGTHIAPHRGPTNMRLRCHLGIRIPQGDCAIRVDGETRAWLEGECIVFDDYYEHEAWNHTAEERIVLIVDLWHPDLSPAEVALLQGLHRYAFAYAHDLNRYWAANARATGHYD